ncbi:hypothetical protein POM88_054815 [Heracleum sosnowskyi]|uniref:Uncharacterized protein n=1 Tax=Heracleum sosnowskyi TaxID=360622 RepID=A0AAD8GMU9_9APIA|nr:hypothetical protein POM88_054815 [Heracleum sosnowskyi]
MMAGRRASSAWGSGSVRGGRGDSCHGSGSGGVRGRGGRGSGSGGSPRDSDGNIGDQGDNNDNGDRGVKDGNGGRPNTAGSGVVGQSSGATGSGEGSGTRARGGGRARGEIRGGARRGRRRLRDEDENSECLLWDDDGRQILRDDAGNHIIRDDAGRPILPLGVDSDPRKHKTRGYSPGGFGKYPDKATVVRISGNLIDCPMALRNLLAAMHMFWPDGCAGVREIDRKSPGFWNKCIDEFLRSYTYDPRFSTESEARASILAHMRDNLRRTLADDRERADVRIVEAAGTTYVDHRPLYMKPGVWSRLAEYWVSEEFKKYSAAGKKARQAVKLPHTSDARSFDHRRRDYMESHDGKLDELVVYKDCHTLKENERKGEWITEDAKLIITDGPGGAKGKAPTTEDDHRDDGEGSGESTESESDHDMSAPPYDVINRGGPVIKG